MENIRKININDKEYPSALKRIKDAPKFLYLKGNFPPLPYFAIVGTRRCSNHGKQIAFQIAKNLTEAGITIVSGMARGIDTSCHKGCLEAGGKTIAVLGTGLDEKSIYPKENLELSQQILDSQGALVSELAPATPGYASNFPKRNRIISGLCLGVLVVEAKQRSGSLITARYALEQERKLFAVPGNISFLNSEGTNSLIKKGAILTRNANDVLKELNLPLQEKPEIMGTRQGKKGLVLSVLLQEPLHIDKIIKITKLGPSEVAAALSILEIEGRIKNLGGNIYTILR